MNEKVLEIKDLIVNRGEGKDVFTLNLKSLCLERGEKIAITGASGSGKTTLLQAIAGLLEIKGSIKCGNHEIHYLDEDERRLIRREMIGLVFQNFELLEYLNVLDNIHISSALNAVSKNNYLNRATELAKKMGLGDKLHRLPNELSHGEQQRVSICRAMLMQPILILADEPTASLDPKASIQVIDLLLDQATKEKSTLLVASHDTSILEKFDRVISIETLIGIKK